jgi:hypothetical protein
MSDIVEALRIQASSDHARDCDRRQHDCECGYDTDTARLLANAADEIERLRAQAATAPATKALAVLVAKLEEVHEHPRFKLVWETAHFRLGPYDGPTYTNELIAAKAALAGNVAQAPGTTTFNEMRNAIIEECARVADRWEGEDNVAVQIRLLAIPSAEGKR